MRQNKDLTQKEKNMKQTDKILIALGFVASGSDFDEKFENFASNFGVQWRPSDLCDAISMSVDNSSAVRNYLVSIMWDRVVSHFVDKGLCEELFNCYINGSVDTHFYYDGVEVFCADDLEEYVTD